ncbi:MAG: GntR family transcriptional regulator [Sulfobacillus sp.]|nr:GntR family transcriptional regulator [Sulfobacillus sp.]
MRIDEDLLWPVHRQLAMQLKAAIEDGTYQPGERLPSVREWATLLRINRNTVVKAYQWLAAAGYVTGESGRGYFAQLPARPLLTERDRQWIQEILLRLRDGETDPVIFAQELLARALTASVQIPKVAVVECTVFQSRLLAKDLGQILGIPVDGLTLEELERLETGALQGYTLFVTTFQHVEEVKERVPGRAGDVVPGLLTAHMETLKKLNQVSKHERVGVACTHWEGTARLREVVLEAGFAADTIIEAAGEEPASLPRLLEDTALVIAASPVAEILLAFRPDAPVVVDDRTFADAVVHMIRDRLGMKETS